MPQNRTRNVNVASWARRAHGLAVLGWLIMLPISILTPLKNSVPYLVGISVWALVASHLSAWAAEHAAEQAAVNTDLVTKETP